MKNLKTQFAVLALSLSLLSALLLIAARPAQAQTESVLYNFCSAANCTDGSHPQSRLTSDGQGNFYGTTETGGTFGPGTVFELSPDGSGGWNETVLYSFTGGADGGYPEFSYVIFDSGGNLYGTTFNGGATGDGVVFELSPVGGGWTETVLYSFANGTDGAYPVNGLIRDTAGNLYGTTYQGGNTAGTVFELSPSGGSWTEQLIYSFSSSAPDNEAGLTMDSSGNIFGASASTVFELSPNGSGGWNPTVIHTFPSAPKDGSSPQGTLVLDAAGNLYGTTTKGGAKDYGTVYKLSLGTNGKWKEKILHSFTGATKDGSEPWAGIVFDAAGNIYGTSVLGGNGNCDSGCGTVFELVALVGTGSYKEKVLWSFNAKDGALPYSSLILDSAGNLYGTTGSGGQSGDGVVFEVNPSAVATKTTLSSSLNPSLVGQTVTFTAVVSSAAGAPPDGETVTFMEGSTVLGTGSLTSGSASFATSALPVGTNLITAVYGGDLNFEGSTSKAVKQRVKP